MKSKGLSIFCIVVGIAMAGVGIERSAWLLHKNAFRAIAELLHTTTAMSQPARVNTSGPRIDILNPHTWSDDPNAGEESRKQKIARMDKVRNQVAFVELAAVAWKWVMVVFGDIIVLLGFISLFIIRWRAVLLLATAILNLAATAITLIGMGLLIRYGGTEPFPAPYYVLVAVAGSAYGWITLAALIWKRRQVSDSGVQSL